jgi:hypothetical protein
VVVVVVVGGGDVVVVVGASVVVSSVVVVHVVVVVVSVVAGGESAKAVATPTAKRSAAPMPAIPCFSGIARIMFAIQRRHTHTDALNPDWSSALADRPSGGRVEERDERLPFGAQERDERGRSDQLRGAIPRARLGTDVPGRSPPEQARAEHQERGAALQDERSVWKVGELHRVQAVSACPRVETLAVELCVDRVRSGLARVERAPHPREVLVVRTAAERAGPVAGGERRCLVQEEELGEATGLEERVAPPAPEREAARDPALSAVAASQVAAPVVEAAAISVHESARRFGDELAERGHPIADRHAVSVAARLS